MDLLIETIPVLCRSKQDVLGFFRGCGVPDNMTADLRQRVLTDRESINKYEIARTVLTRINEGGDGTLRQRREVLKRVSEFEDFSTCWPKDQFSAQGLVAKVRHVINVKDSFTRMQQAEEQQRQDRVRRNRAAAEAKQRRREERQALRSRLAGLSSMSNAQQRGKALEGVLNDIFKLDGLRLRDAFTLNTEDGHVGEQIDGLITLDGTQPILVEAKWHTEPIGREQVTSHLVRLFNRPGVHGLYVSASRFTKPAIEECERALAHRVIMLAEIHELLMLLEEPNSNVASWLKAKLFAASVDRKPLFYPTATTV
jgi:restriction endonuclease Mrr